MTRLYADPERSLQPGEEAVFPQEKAEQLIAAGCARAIEGQEVRNRPVAPAKNRSRTVKPAKEPEKNEPQPPAGDGQGDGDGQGGGADGGKTS
jgi:hypothetical protein